MIKNIFTQIFYKIKYFRSWHNQEKCIEYLYHNNIDFVHFNDFSKSRNATCIIIMSILF